MSIADINPETKLRNKIKYMKKEKRINEWIFVYTYKKVSKKTPDWYGLVSLLSYNLVFFSSKLLTILDWIRLFDLKKKN